jgi:hypothetical protein
MPVDGGALVEVVALFDKPKNWFDAYIDHIRGSEQVRNRLPFILSLSIFF